MITLNLQYFGGRGSAAGKRTNSREPGTVTVNSKDIDKATFKKDLGGTWGASAGTVTDYDGTEEKNGVEMRIVSNREDGRTFYTTRFIVKGQGRDWQYSDTEYYSLNSAKNGVKSDVKSYLSNLKPRTTTKTASNPNKKSRASTPTQSFSEQLASTRERARSLSTSMELRKAYRTAFSKEERRIYADELKRRGYKVPRGNIYHTNA